VGARDRPSEVLRRLRAEAAALRRASSRRWPPRPAARPG